METNTLFSNIHTYSAKHQLINPDDTIVIGLSGGPDSLFLLHYLVSLRESMGISLIAAHLDHGWRPDSENDVKFCREACRTLGVRFTTQKISELSKSWKFNGSLEEIGRKARRHFLEATLKEHGAQTIALGHHLQDQQETFFIRLLRGSSLSGLASMRPKAGPFIRPLLGISKEEIISYLKEHGISYLEDPSNESDTFLRNRIRQQVIPALKACDTRFDSSFEATLNRLQALETYLEQETRVLLCNVTICQFGKSGLNLKYVLKLPSIMQERLLIAWLCQEQVPFPPREQFLQEMMKFLKSPRGGMHQMHYAWSIGKKSTIVWIEKINSGGCSHE